MCMQCSKLKQPVKPPHSQFFLPKRYVHTYSGVREDRLEEGRESIYRRESEPGARSVIDDFVDEYVKKHNQGEE